MGAVRTTLTGFDVFTGYVDSVVRVFLSVFMASMFVLLLLSVLSRYVINQPFFWLAEGAGYLMALLGLWGSSTCIRVGGHMQVNIIQKRLAGEGGDAHRVARDVLTIVIYGSLLVFCYVLIHYGYRFADFGRFEYSPSGFFIVFWPRLAVPTGGVLIALQSMNLIGRAIVDLVDKGREKRTANLTDPGKPMSAARDGVETAYTGSDATGSGAGGLDAGDSDAGESETKE